MIVNSTEKNYIEPGELDYQVSMKENYVCTGSGIGTDKNAALKVT